MHIAAHTEDHGNPDEAFDEEEQDPNDPDTFKPFDNFAVQFVFFKIASL